ncbi:MAG: hypothetical protein LBK75_04715 [Oscillospiraceae bacterium]|jgi:hypothetical protein|nr:hypothetical protein [Oscillospiraceae bacterium]
MELIAKNISTFANACGMLQCSRKRYCRLLVGTAKTPRREIIEIFADPERLMMDNARAKEMRLRLAEEFAEQLTIGRPMQNKIPYELEWRCGRGR